MSNIKGNKSNILAKEQKLQILAEVEDGEFTQKELASKYGISLSALKTWISKYDKFGESSLISQTGKTDGQKFKKNNLDSKDREISRLNKIVKQQALEVDILKKFDEWMRKKTKNQ